MKAFEIKEEHLKLLQRMYVGWDHCEFGAPEIDPKRPYGNSSVYQDMIKILGLTEIKEGVFKFSIFGEEWILKGEDRFNLYLEGKDEWRLLEILNKLHKETRTALQICLARQKFEVGLFTAEDYTQDWHLSRHKEEV